MNFYTAVIGPNTDHLRAPVHSDGSGFYCASDQAVNCTPWKHVPTRAGKDPMRAARLFKQSLPFRDDGSEVYCWMDAAFELRVTSDVLLDALGDADLATFRHPHWSTLFEEADAIERAGWATRETLDAQLDRYLASGFPFPPLQSSGFLVVRRNHRTRLMHRIWTWEFKRAGHNRDQMSSDYAAWRAGVNIRYLEGCYTDNPYAEWSDG